MSETKPNPKPSPNWWRRIWATILILLAGLILMGFGLRWWITTENGANFIEAQIESRSFGPIEKIEIEGVSGDPLKEFSVDQIKLHDSTGHFLTLNDLQVTWSVWPLRRRHLEIDKLTIAGADVLRRPVFARAEPSSGKPFTVHLGTADIDALTLHEPVIGQAAVLRVSAKGGLEDNGTLTAVLKAIRTDAAGDSVELDFSRTSDGNIDGTFALAGVPEGTVATLLRAPTGAIVTGEGDISGTIEAGGGTALIGFADTQAVDAKLIWSPETATLTANVNTVGWPIFDKTRQALGRSVNVSAKLSRAQTPRSFVVNAAAENFSAKLSGALAESSALPDALNFDISSARLGAILPLPTSYTLGRGSVKGSVVLGENMSGRAVLDVANVNTPSGRAARISGPALIAKEGDAFRFETELNASNPVTATELPFTLGESAVLSVKGLVDLQAREVSKVEASLVSAGNKTTAKGSAAFDGSQLYMSGDAQVNVKAIGALPAGAVAAKYKLRKTVASDLAVTADGTFRVEGAFAAPLNNLLDDVIHYDVQMIPVEGGVEIGEALIRSGGLRATISGRVTQRLDLKSEIALSRPVNIAALHIEAPSQFSVALTGPRADPNLRLDGTLESAALADQIFETVRLRTEMTDLIAAPKGPIRLTAETSYGPLDVEGRFASTDAGYALADLDVNLAGMTAGGDIALDSSNIATGRVELNLPQEGERYAKAFVDLTNVAGEQGIALQIEAKNLAYGDIGIDEMMAQASGTLAALSGDISVKGRRTDTLLTREVGLKTPLSLQRSPEFGYRLSLTPEADYGRYQIGHTDIVSLEYNEGRIDVSAPLTLNGKPLSIDYARGDTAENLRIRARDLPVNLLPLPGPLGEAKGQISINLNARIGDGQPLSGQGVINVADLRGFSVDAGDGFTTAATMDLQPNAVVWRLENAQGEDFNLSGEGRVPLLPAQQLMALRPDMTAAMRGKLNLSGSAKPLLSLVTVEDAEPDGNLEAKLDISGTLGAPQVQGEANGSALRLELPNLGTRLRDGRFTAGFTNDTIAVSDVYLRDSGDGTLNGSGQFKLGEFGRPLGRLDIAAKSFRALDRKDYEGRATGSLYFESDAEKATFGGDVKINRAEVKQFVQGLAAVVEIEVEEINGAMEDIDIQVRRPTVPIYLDLRVRAPRRMFVRTRGIDVELETDITVKGTVSEPLLYGTANVLRGGYKIAGKTLEFTEGGVTFSGTLPDARVNLKAETNTQNISATVDISGTVAKPEIVLSSTPERPQDEILSALLFGRSVTELSTIEAAQLAGALAQLSGAGGGFDLLGGLRDALGVGQFSIGVDEDGQALISGGRYLAKDVYLQVFRGAGAESTGAVIDWEIRRNLFLRSKVQADSEQSLSLKFKRDF